MRPSLSLLNMRICSRWFVLVLTAFLLAFTTSPTSFADAAPPSDVYVYSLIAWTANDKLDATVARYMSAQKDSPDWAIEFLNNSTDILPNTTIHHVAEDHGSDPITAIRMFNAFLESAIYPVALVIVESADADVNKVVAKMGNALDITVATVMGPGSEYTDQNLYSNLLRGVSTISTIHLPTYFLLSLFVIFISLRVFHITLHSLSKPTQPPFSLLTNRLMPQLTTDKP